MLYHIDQSIVLPSPTWAQVRSICHAPTDQYGDRLLAITMMYLLCECGDFPYSKEMAEYIWGNCQRDIWWGQVRTDRPISPATYRERLKEEEQKGLVAISYSDRLQKAIEVWNDFQTYSEKAFTYRPAQILTLYAAIAPAIIDTHYGWVALETWEVDTDRNFFYMATAEIHAYSDMPLRHIDGIKVPALVGPLYKGLIAKMFVEVCG